MYFNSKGEFREDDLKGQRINELFAIQTIEKYSDTVTFIRQVLSPYRESLVVLPSTTPELVMVRVKIAKKAPPFIRSIECFGKELLVDGREQSMPAVNKMWRLSLKQFGLETLKASISEAWYVPMAQLRIKLSPALANNVCFRLPKGKMIIRPSR